MTKSKMMIEPEVAVRRLALEHPAWIPVLEAAVAVAGEVEESGGEFAGAWVVDRLASAGGQRWVPNLRILVSHGFLEKSGETVRSGKRAYYRMIDRAAVAAALAELRAAGPMPRRTLRLVGAGSSSGRRDTARRAGEQRFEPRSWR